jgi:hypothetical protein
VPNAPGVPAADLDLHTAFRELHGRRLHGFTLLLCLGETERAATLAGEALSAGAARAADLAHPERAAAWLRARVTRRAGQTPNPSPVAAGAVSSLGADWATLVALASLDPRSRAAVIARFIEGFDTRDVATIARREGRELDRLLDRGLARFIDAHATTADPDVEGPLVGLVHDTAQRAIR